MAEVKNTANLPAARLLLVDADSMICELLQYKFENEGYAVDVAHSAQEALALSLGVYHLILFDLMADEFNGIRFARELRDRSETRNVPLIVISADDNEDRVVETLDAGADDYIIKPFSARELVARIRSVLRRRMATARRMSNVMRYKDLSIDFSTSVLTIADRKISLTRTEYLILAMFLRHRNQFFDRAEIIHEAWEEEGASERAVDTNISRLRKKLGEYGKNIVNRQGFGYGFIE
ncbi:MAG: response regulator transcription factor [Paramuribaculum sp.]|nr:response regulator transcription factor [Paramuribaculum sp.]MDE7452528.1 response regulator transcription factor [Paramuribaculum sp.]